MNAREWSLRHVEFLRAERGALADLLLSLSEFDRVAAYRELGFATLFDYLHRELRLSRGSAHYRQVATRLVVRFPEIVEPIRDGRLCLTTVIVLARVMTEANRYEVLPRFFGLSRQEAEQIAAEIRPVEVVPRRTVVTAAPVARPAATPATVTGNVKEYSRSIVELAPARTLVEPLTRTETRMHVTVSPEFVALLKKAKAGQSHVQPGATDEQVLTAALELLIAQQEKRRASVPPKVKREVMKRDGGKCTWPLAAGGTCGATIRLQVDHVIPRGRGGPSTVDNCRILCDVHNREAARQVYGDAHMDLFAPRLPRASEPVAEWVTRGETSGPATWHHVCVRAMMPAACTRSSSAPGTASPWSSTAISWRPPGSMRGRDSRSPRAGT